MRHRKSGKHLGRSPSHRRALFRNQVTDLLRHERLVTTEAKAKEVKGLAERMITLGKRGQLQHRRRALSFIFDDKVVGKLFDEIAARYQEREGGYTRLTKLGPRKGDNAPMVQLELIQ